MRSVVLSLIFALPGGSMAAADTHLILPDGTGDFATIQEAIDASADGDIIELADGTFRGPGNRDLDYHGRAITVRSQGGNPGSCIIDCEGSATQPARGFHLHAGEGSSSIIQGLTIAHGYSSSPADQGGGVRLVRTHPVIQDCVFVGNFSLYGGGGVLAAHGSPSVLRCRFENNSGGLTEGGAIYCWNGAPNLSECVFLGNAAQEAGGVSCWNGQLHATDCAFIDNEGGPGAVVVVGGNALFEGCLFDGNESPTYGGAVECAGGSPVFRRCTFWRNRGPAGGGAVYCQNASEPTFLRCTFVSNSSGYDAAGLKMTEQSHATLIETILAFGSNGWAIRCGSGGSATLSCCNVYGNQLGDWEECIADQFGMDGNISADPLFCDLPGGDFTLSCDSPCAPGGNPPCGLIGAWPVGCGVSPVHTTTWGRVKLLFRKLE